MNSGTTATKKKKKKHVFLFRHCVRSTDSNVYLFNHTTTLDDSSDISIPITKFWSRLAQPEVILPSWNVPKNWCTENGMQQMQQTGSYIYNTLLRQDEGGSSRRLKFRFISDRSQRDVDTTFALQEGIASAILLDTVNMDLYMLPQDGSSSSSTSTISLASTNVHSAEYIPNLFQPFVSTTMSPTPMCTLQVTKQQMLDEAQERLNNIVPKPPSNIYNTLQLLQIDGLNMMDVDDMNNVTITSDSREKPQLRGMINFLKLVAQLIFYSRASGIVPRQFLYRITTSQLYTILLPYIYYTRSILNVGTTEAATRGALLARTMMDALQLDDDDDEDDDVDVDTVTILVGHDTDLDAVATAMNVAWEFDLPYNTNDMINSSSFLLWYMTPPGSAIYLSHESFNDNDSNDNDTKVTMSYFHPIYNIDKNDGSITSYDMVPLQLSNNNIDDDNNNNGGNVYQINNNSVTIQWNALQRHINVTLQQYAGAFDCYYKTVPVAGRQPPTISNSLKNDSSSSTDSKSMPTMDPTDSVKPPTTAPIYVNPSLASSGSNNTPSVINDQQLSKSWGSGFGSGIAAAILLALLIRFYSFRKQRRLRSQYSQPHFPSSSSLQMNEYSDADDTETVATSNRGKKKRNVDII